MPEIRLAYERPRGCGYRKGGGIYLVGGLDPAPCGKLPLQLHACPTCGGGVRFCRSWKWVDAGQLFAELRGPCRLPGPAAPVDYDAPCRVCPAADPVKLGRCGLMWVGEKFYPTPAHFAAEAVGVGVSKRIAKVPRDLRLGETWVLLAHRVAIAVPCPEGCQGDEQVGGGPGRLLLPGVFCIFRPRAIEYVVRGDETPAELERLAERGFSLVSVVPLDADGQMPLEAAAGAGGAERADNLT